MFKSYRNTVNSIHSRVRRHQYQLVCWSRDTIHRHKYNILVLRMLYLVNTAIVILARNNTPATVANVIRHQVPAFWTESGLNNLGIP